MMSAPNGTWRLPLITSIAVLVLMATATHATTVTIDVPPEEFGGPATVTAELAKPRGDGPFPAIVLLHGCGGLWAWGDVWSKRLVSWGYVTIRIDSFSPRGYPEGICLKGTKVDQLSRASDAHAAKRYLQTLAFVEPERIGVMGMSHGGWTVLWAVQYTYIRDAPRADPFKAAVALYPSCDRLLDRLDAPLLILIGDLDDWAFAERCERMVIEGPMTQSVTLKVYPGAHHAFDINRPTRVRYGHTMAFDPDAARDAASRIKAFLQEHL